MKQIYKCLILAITVLTMGSLRAQMTSCPIYPTCTNGYTVARQFSGDTLCLTGHITNVDTIGHWKVLILKDVVIDGILSMTGPYQQKLYIEGYADIGGIVWDNLDTIYATKATSLRFRDFWSIGAIGRSTLYILPGMTVYFKEQPRNIFGTVETVTNWHNQLELLPVYNCSQVLSLPTQAVRTFNYTSQYLFTVTNRQGVLYTIYSTYSNMVKSFPRFNEPYWFSIDKKHWFSRQKMQ